MLNSHLKNIAASSLVAAAALLGAVSPAQAVVYVGNWDPAFGGLFPNLGFKGNATYFLPDACVGLSGSFSNAIDSGTACGSGEAKITAASIEFYNNSNSSVILQTLNFTGLTAPVISFAVATVDGKTNMTGITTDGYSTGVVGTIAESKIGTNLYEFSLSFSGNTTTLGYGRIFPQDRLNCISNNATCGFSETSPTVTFTPAIPEPETYALMLAGLAGVAFVARRRRAN